MNLSEIFCFAPVLTVNPEFTPCAGCVDEYYDMLFVWSFVLYLFLNLSVEQSGNSEEQMHHVGWWLHYTRKVFHCLYSFRSDGIWWTLLFGVVDNFWGSIVRGLIEGLDQVVLEKNFPPKKSLRFSLIYFPITFNLAYIKLQ